MRCLSILFNRLFWLLAFSFFFFFSSSVFASCPAGYPSTTGNISYYPSGWLHVTDYQPTQSLACAALQASGVYGGTALSYDSGQNKCVGTGVSLSVLSSGSCAAGYTLNGSECTCQSCPDSGSFFGAGQISGSGSSGCSGGCSITSGGSCISSNDPITGLVSSNWCSNWTYTGASCTGDDATQSEAPDSVPSENGGRPTKPSDCPPQTGYAEVNGSSMCLPSGSSYSGGSATSTDSSTGNTTQINTTTTINNDGTRTTTTITNVYGSGGGLLSTNTTTQTDGQIGDGKGKEDSSFGDAPTFDDTLPGEAVFDIKTQTGQTLSTDIFSVSASCPAPIVFEALGQEFSIGFQPVCDLAHIIRGIILMLAAIAAIRIIVQGG